MLLLFICILLLLLLPNMLYQFCTMGLRPFYAIQFSFIHTNVNDASPPNRAHMSSASIPPSFSGNRNEGNPGGGSTPDSGVIVCNSTGSGAGESYSILSTTDIISGVGPVFETTAASSITTGGVSGWLTGGTSGDSSTFRMLISSSFRVVTSSTRDGGPERRELLLAESTPWALVPQEPPTTGSKSGGELVWR